MSDNKKTEVWVIRRVREGHACGTCGEKHGPPWCLTGCFEEDRPRGTSRFVVLDIDDAMARVNSLETQLAESRAAVEEAVVILRDVECSGDDGLTYCPDCYREVPGHAEDCHLAAFLARHNARAKGKP